jgi:hypothetical protein
MALKIITIKVLTDPDFTDDDIFLTHQEVSKMFPDNPVLEVSFNSPSPQETKQIEDLGLAEFFEDTEGVWDVDWDEVDPVDLFDGDPDVFPEGDDHED